MLKSQIISFHAAVSLPGKRIKFSGSRQPPIRKRSSDLKIRQKLLILPCRSRKLISMSLGIFSVAFSIAFFKAFMPHFDVTKSNKFCSFLNLILSHPMTKPSLLIMTNPSGIRSGFLDISGGAFILYVFAVFWSFF